MSIEQPIQYVYPPPYRERKGKFGGVKAYRCMNCGRYGGVRNTSYRFRCFFCQTDYEFVLPRAESDAGGSQVLLPLSSFDN